MLVKGIINVSPAGCEAIKSNLEPTFNTGNCHCLWCAGRGNPGSLKELHGAHLLSAGSDKIICSTAQVGLFYFRDVLMGLLSKKDLREQILAKRQALVPERVRDWSENVQKRLLESSFWPSSGRVGLYSPVKNEVETMTLFQRAIEGGLHVYFPRVEGGLWYYEVDGPEHLQRGAWGVLEPVGDCEPLPEDEFLDLLVTPGVAFDESGHRIGYGRGIYDRFLKSAPMKRVIGLAFEMQIVPPFETDPWDVRLDAVVTETRTILAQP